MKKFLFFSFLFLLLSVWKSFANEIWISAPEFQDFSWSTIAIKHLDVQTSIQYDINYTDCSYGNWLTVLNNERKSIFTLKNKYIWKLTGINWDAYNIPLPECDYYGKGNSGIDSYPMYIYTNYEIHPLGKYIDNTYWKVSQTVSNPEDILTYPSNFFTAQTLGTNIVDKVWCRDGSTPATYIGCTIDPFLDFIKTDSWWTFSTTGILSGRWIASNQKKSWYWAIGIISEASKKRKEVVHFQLPSPNWVKNTTFHLVVSPWFIEKPEVTLYKNNVIIRQLKKNRDYWIRPSRIEAAQSIDFHPEKFSLEADEVRISVTPISY